MTKPKPLFIAEVKTCSPFGFKSDKSWRELFELALSTADMLSIHVEQDFGGNLQSLELARKLCHIPILAKGYHKTNKDVDRSFEAGADNVLVVGRKPPYDKYGVAALLYEPLSAEYIHGYRNYPMVWNARDLRTGNKKSDSINSIRNKHKSLLYQASFIKSPDDIADGVDGFIVGEHLPEFIKALSRR